MGFPSSILKVLSYIVELNGSAWDTSGSRFVQIPSVVLEIRCFAPCTPRARTLFPPVISAFGKRMRTTRACTRGTQAHARKNAGKIACLCLWCGLVLRPLLPGSTHMTIGRHNPITVQLDIYPNLSIKYKTRGEDMCVSHFF